MKAPSNDLFLLIKTMTKSEKKYFRQYSERYSNNKKNNSLVLFDAINSFNHYDEFLLKQSLSEHPFFKYFAVAKRYLYQQILESLDLFYRVNSIREKIKRQFHFSAILIQKGLLEQARKELNKAAKIISEYELFEYNVLYIETERKLIQAQKFSITNRNDSYSDLKNTLVHISNANWYWLKNNIVLQLHLKKVNVFDEDQKKVLDDIEKEFLKKEPPLALKLRLGYYKTLATISFMKGEVNKAYKYNKIAIDLFESNPKLIELEPQLYLANINNFLIDNFNLKKYDVVEDGLKKMRSLSGSGLLKSLSRSEEKIFELTYTLQLNSSIAQNNFLSAMELIPMIKIGLHKYKKTMPANYYLQFNYLIAYVLFVNKSFEEALTCLEEIKQPKYKTILEELRYAANRLYFLCHFELDNILLLDSLMLSMKRLQKKDNRQIALDDLLFKFLRQISNSVMSRDERIEMFTKLKDQMQLLKLDSNNKKAWVYFDFDQWLDKKINPIKIL
ncbi:MAG: hypothetical protein MK207_04460 [Saprospiraceae bacterium]|nr:hypothetical protein [Saprospiraceae bacterium]